MTDATKQYDFTSQLFFEESQNDKVFAQAPYNKKGTRDRTNESDGIYRQSGGSLLVKVAAADKGYAGKFDIGLDLSDVNVGGEETRRGPGGPAPERRG